MARVELSEKFIRSPRRVPAKGRVEFRDSLMPGLVLRVGDTGHRAFVLIKKFPGAPHAVRRSLGQYGELTVEDAREMAREWVKLIKRGIDPKQQAIETRAEAAAKAERTKAQLFGKVAEDYASQHLDTLKSAAMQRQLLDSEFVRRWSKHQITEVTRQQIAEALRDIAKRRGQATAHNAMSLIRHFWNWTIGNGAYSLQASPMIGINARAVIGARVIRERVLKDDELRRVWAGAGEIGYPFGMIVRMLILTGQRLSEISDLSWDEIDLYAGSIRIGAKRMKGGRAHEVPLAPMALALLNEMPRYRRGGFVFSTRQGAIPFNGFSKGKDRIDEASGVKEWRLHDLRRTARTHFSALPVQDNVRELVIAHARPGLHAVYDLHSYASEKRECLELWEQRLASILAK